MGTELVTGHKGTVHVDSADDASLYAAIVGKGEYVLQLGNKFACTMATANKAHIASGHGLMQGRHWLVDNEGEDLTIQNGTQGQKRNDLIVARYECDPKNDNVESVVLKVIKGTPTTGTPSDPAYAHGDILDGNALVNEMPLWRIPLNGITVGTPVKLFAESASAQERWDSVSHAEVHEIAEGVFFFASGRVGVVSLAFRHYQVGAWSYARIASLPDGKKPASIITVPLGTEAKRGCWMQVTDSSDVLIGCNAEELALTDSVWGQAVFPVL